MPGFNVPNVPNACLDPQAFREDGAFPGPTYLTETARQHRYVLQVLEPLGDRDSGLLLYLARCTRPTLEFDEITIHNGQDEIYRPGKQRWHPVEFSFYEKVDGQSPPYTNQATRLLYEWWGKAVVDLRRSLFAGPPNQYLKMAQLDMLDGVGQPIWRYEMYDCWPSKITPGDLAYDETGIAQISVTLRFSRCQEKIVTSG